MLDWDSTADSTLLEVQVYRMLLRNFDRINALLSLVDGLITLHQMHLDNLVGKPSRLAVVGVGCFGWSVQICTWMMLMLVMIVVLTLILTLTSTHEMSSMQHFSSAPWSLNFARVKDWDAVQLGLWRWLNITVETSTKLEVLEWMYYFVECNILEVKIVGFDTAQQRTR